MKKKKITVDVKGMSCASCAAGVKNAALKTEGVLDVSVSLMTNQATLVFDLDKTSLDTIAKNVSKIGYQLVLEKAKAEEEFEDARKKLILSFAFIVPAFIVMLLDMFKIMMIPYMDYFELIFSFPVIFIAGFDVLKRAFKGLVHGVFSMDLLIATGSCVSFLSGILKILFLDILNFALIGAMIMFFHLLGKYLEALAKGKASKAIQGLLELGAKTARIIVDDIEVEVPVQQLDKDDIMVIRPGEKIPTDGVIIEGETTVDESMATGESMPVLKTVNFEVLGGTINQTGAIKVKVTKVGEDTFLSQLIKLVEEAQNSRVPIQDFADKVTSYFVPVVLMVSISVFLFWFFQPDLGKEISIFGSKFIPWVNPNLNRISQAAFASIATVVIACPCALGLATPTAIMVSSGLGAKNGVLIRNGKAIQVMKDINTIVFDKTGTLTYGKPSVSDILDLTQDGSGFKILASIEKLSEHPIAKAIVEYQEKNKSEFLDVKNFIATPGIGAEGEIQGKSYFIKRFNGEETQNEKLKAFYEKATRDAKTTVALFSENKPLTVLTVSDSIKENVKDAIKELLKMGIEPVMLTGDNEAVAKRIADEAGIKTVYAEVLPKDKVNIIKELKRNKKVVAMVGDGINDAGALQEANVGIAIGTGSDIAIEAGDIVLYKGDIFGVIKAVKLSRATFKKIKQNLFWALFYNIAAIPIASLGFLHPVIAEIAMALSSINVITNSLRLNKTNLEVKYETH